MKRLGCLTTSGLLAGLITALVITGIAIAQGGVLFNPGPLNAQEGPALGGVTSHAMIGGECKACHVAPWEQGSMDDRCLRCHQAIAIEKGNPQSLHGAIYQRNPGASCRACHTEHKGPDSPLTHVSMQDFPHEAVGFSLAAHQQKADGQAFACTDCHTQGLQTFDMASCENCHRQRDVGWMASHIQAYGNNCLACHDGVDRFGRGFVHPARFPLEGKHATVGCEGCHRGARAVADFKVSSASCVSCHQKDDPHQGRFGTNCETCHTTAGWKPANFDHNLAAFKLTGKHQQVACESCHQNGVFKGTPMDCFSCHRQNDPHQGQMPQCETCHTTAGWKPATFDHSRSRFPLTGAHVQVACRNCHQSLAFKGTPTECIACHRADEPHQGRFGTNCALCHSTSAWKPATFDHNLSGFPLTGAHARLACESCHRGGNFSGLPTSCAACHGEPTFHAGAFGTNCASCHSTNAWRPAKFNLPHPEPRVHEHGSGINHGGASCRTCHPSTVHTYTCTACHSGNPGDGEGGGDDHEGGGGDDD
jgi:hypothetical protein